MFHFETVESRQLLADPVGITAKLSKTGLLTINGTGGKDVIEVNHEGTKIRVTSSGAIDFLAAYGRTGDSFDTSKVRKIVVNGGAGNDKIKVKLSTDTIGGELNGDAGNDSIVVSMSKATLRGGNGDDYLASDKAGFSVLQYNTGGTNYALAVGSADAFNRLEGGAGNDRLASRGSEDTLVGGTGTDVFEKLNDLTVFLGDLPARTTTNTGNGEWTQVIPSGNGTFTEISQRNRAAVFEIESILAAPSQQVPTGTIVGNVFPSTDFVMPARNEGLQSK